MSTSVTPPGRTPGRGDSRTYYHYPALKRAEWGWKAVLYLFLGGLASGSYLVATLAELFGSRGDRIVARAGRYIALVAIAFCPLLLIADLGRPERFLHMLRIVKPRSPMSMGVWGLTGFGLFVGLGALRQAVEDGLIRPDSPVARPLAWVPLQVSGVLGSLLAFFVGSYTGVLLSFTNVPFWARNRLFQGPLFLTSALSTGLAAISLSLAGRRDVAPSTWAWLGQAERAATLGELALVAGMLASLGRVGRPILHRPLALPFWLGAVGLRLVAPPLLQRGGDRLTGGPRGVRAVVAGLAVLLSGLVLRAVTVLAGRESADDALSYLRLGGDNRRGTIPGRQRSNAP